MTSMGAPRLSGPAVNELEDGGRLHDSAVDDINGAASALNNDNRSGARQAIEEARAVHPASEQTYSGQLGATSDQADGDRSARPSHRRELLTPTRRSGAP